MNEDFRAPGVSDKENDDVLGLEKPIKITHRAKIAKIDDERMFNRSQGLDYVIKNYTKMIRVMKRNDSKLNKKLNGISNPVVKKKLKFQNEFDNLSSILQFYQLWCHGLFPKANFRDCLRMIRVYGGKSPRMRIYRRELLDQQINKLKEQNGISVNENSESFAPVDVDSNISNIAEPLAVVDHNATIGNRQDNENYDGENNDDDWSFMNKKRTKNSLFIDEDDDDLYEHSNKEQNKINTATPSSNQENSNAHAQDEEQQFPDDEDFDIPDQNSSKQVAQEDEEDHELQLMREMGF